MHSVLDGGPGKTINEKVRWQFRHVCANGLSVIDKEYIGHEIDRLCEEINHRDEIEPLYQIQLAVIIGRFMASDEMRNMEPPTTDEWTDEHEKQRSAAIEVYKQCLGRIDEVIGYTP
jgi:hypothetical protein